MTLVRELVEPGAGALGQRAKASSIQINRALGSGKLERAQIVEHCRRRL
jgi:hypothetical protein